MKHCIRAALFLCLIHNGSGAMVALKLSEREITTRDTLPPRRAHHALLYDPVNKCILLNGGSTPVDGGKSFIFYNDLWSFDKKGWKYLGDFGDKRSAVSLAFDSRRAQIFSLGGYTSGQSAGDLRLLQKTGWKTIHDTSGVAAADPGFVYDSQRDRLVAFGGSAGRDKVQSDTWEWDGSSWKKLNIASPPGRLGFSMIYDLKRKKTVLFGGAGLKNKFDDTWEFDGLSWTKIPAAGPVARVSHGTAYDSKRGVLLIFGGIGNQGVLGDTWGWDGNTWKKLSDNGPAPRSMGYMAYDIKRDRVLLFGGRSKWPDDLDDTWEWNGKEWKEIK